MEESNVSRASSGKRNFGVIISFIVVLLVVSVVVIARFYPHTHKTQTQATIPTKTMPPVANVMYIKISPTPVLDTSNAQLEQDIQHAQGSLDTVDSNLNTADQAINQ